VVGLSKTNLSINLAAGRGVVVREYQTNVGPSDYILCNKKSRLILRPNVRGSVRLTMHEEQI